jgi:hypothetical protein
MLLLVVAVSSPVGGFAQHSQTTPGVGIIAVVCFLAILAGMWKARRQHSEQKAGSKGLRQVDRA